MSTINLIFGIVIGVFIGYLFARIRFYTHLRKHGKKTVEQSRSTTLGYVNEKIAPLLPNFPYNFKDLTYLGKGVDYLVFDGLSEGECKKVIFLEIKSGKSNLNKNERLIRECIEKKHVHYEIFKM